LGTTDDQFGSSIAMSRDGLYMYVGAPGADKVFCYALATRTEATQSLVGDGVTQDFTLTTAAANPVDLIVFATLRSAEFIPTVDYTVSGTTLHFNTAPTNFERIDIIRRSKYYKNIGYLTGTINSNFGCSVVTNRDGSVIAIGSNLETTNSIDNNGKLAVYHRTITEFVTDGVSGTYTAPDAFNTVFRITFNGTELVNGTDYYTVGTSSVQFPSFATPAVGTTT